MREQEPDGPGRTTERAAPRAGLAAAGLCAAALVEARFRSLTDAARDAAAALDAPTDPATPTADPARVAEWIAAGRAIEPLVACLVAGGLVGALAVATRGAGARKRVAAAVLAALAAAAALVLPAAPGDPALALTTLPFAAFGAAALGAACATWIAAPLFAALFRPRWTVALTAACVVLPIAHVAHVLRRGEAPRHAVVETTAWLAETADGVAPDGDVVATDLAVLRAAAGASVRIAEDPASADERWRAWMVTAGGLSREVVQERGADYALDAGPAPAAFVGARRARESRRASTRSAPRAPSLITVAVDGLRSDDVARLVHARAAPPEVQALAEAGLFFPEVYAPTSDPARNEAAWLAGAHPLALGRAPAVADLAVGEHAVGEHAVADEGGTLEGDALEGGTLASASARDGMRVAALREGPPRAGALDGFAQVACGLGADLVPRARRFVAAHAEERFHLHLSFTRLDPRASWDDAAETRTSPRPADDPGFDALVARVDERVRERTQRAPRVADPEPLDPAWTAHLTAAHAERTRALLADLGALLDDLDRLDLARRTIVVIAGTSGVALGEHDHLGYGRDLFPGSVRVPVLVRGPGIARNERRDGPRALVDLAGGLRRALGVRAFPDPTPVAWFDAPRDAPILLAAPDATWNGVRGREVLGLVSGEVLVHWCRDAEGDIGLLPGYGPWRMYRTDTNDGRAVDLAPVPRYAADLERARTELSAALERVAARRAAAEARLAPWAVTRADDARDRVDGPGGGGAR